MADLPSELVDVDEDAKRFDVLMLQLQSCVLRPDRAFGRLRDRVRAILGVLEDQASIPMVAGQLPLIEEMQTDEYWTGVTVPMLENARRRLRSLIRLIERARRGVIYTNFEDEIGTETVVEFDELRGGADPFEQFRLKARHFLTGKADHAVVRKLRTNEPLASRDLEQLEELLTSAGIGSEVELARAKSEAQGLGLFVRSLLGIERAAAERAFSAFVASRCRTSNQIEFVKLLIDHVADHGVVDAGVLYQSPFTDVSPRGPEGIFVPGEVDELVAVLAEVRRRAAA